MHQFPTFTQAWNSTCFGQFLCPSSGVHSLYTRHRYISYRFEDSFRAGPEWNAVPTWSCSKAVFKPVWHISVPRVQWMNSGWWTDELPETCRVSCRSKFGKLVHLVGFIIKKKAHLKFHFSIMIPPHKLSSFTFSHWHSLYPPPPPPSTRPVARGCKWVYCAH
jgi:hypothetical protein